MRTGACIAIVVAVSACAAPQSRVPARHAVADERHDETPPAPPSPSPSPSPSHVVAPPDVAARLEKDCRAWLRGDQPDALACLSVFPEFYRNKAVEAAAALLDDLCEARPTFRGCAEEALSPTRPWFSLERAKRVADALSAGSDPTSESAKALLFRPEMAYYDVARARRMIGWVETLCDDATRAGQCASLAPYVLEPKLPHHDAASADRVLRKLARWCGEGTDWSTCVETFARAVTRDPKLALSVAKRLCDGATMCGPLAQCYRFGGCGVAKDPAKAEQLEARTPPPRKRPQEIHCCACAMGL